MASFSAQLRVGGQSYPLRGCDYGLSQGVALRGRVSTRVHYELVQLTLDVPTDDFLLAWGADPHRQLAAEIVFLAANGGAALESLVLPAAYCVRYAELFRSGDAADGAYQCQLTLADPAGWHWQPGASATYQAPAAGSYAAPLAARPLGGRAASPVAATVGAAVARLPLITGHPPFKVKGPSKGKPGLDRPEFVRQVQGQQDGLNRLTVAEFLANRAHYATLRQQTGDGRDPAGDAAQQLARDKALENKTAELLTEDEDLTYADARAKAEQWLASQAALHDPDQVAGGHPHQVTGLGDARINSSIGAQWPKRIAGIDAQIRQYASTMSVAEQASTFLHIELPIH